ncbi:hypothetical protein [Streptomyces carpinensis]|uniref:HAD family hydrolase n=1 Tax=Streptomyces carpinensis TaxID=66369 RepID=A0ABV1VV27_9ACTN|nr:hypothetical protein [Streptomyces carpinensis]
MTKLSLPDKVRPYLFDIDGVLTKTAFRPRGRGEGTFDDYGCQFRLFLLAAYERERD